MSFPKGIRVCSRSTTGAILLVLAISLAGCKAPQPRDAASAYRAVEARFIDGNLKLAEETARSVAARFPASSSLGGRRLNVQHAKILLYQGRNADAIALLNQPIGTVNSSAEENALLARQYLLLSIASFRAGQTSASTDALAKAQSLPRDPVLEAAILRTRGSIALEQGRGGEAEPLFQACLDSPLDPQLSPREAKFFQSEMLVNLGVAAMQQEHYEDAINRFQTASSMAQSIGARLELEKILGNLGWTYHKTGDYTRGLQNSRRAAAEAASIGAVRDELRWLINAGLSEFDANDIVAARASLETSLRLAEKLQNQALLLDTRISLASLLLPIDPAGAAVHIKEAHRIADALHSEDDQIEAELLALMLHPDAAAPGNVEPELLSLVSRSEKYPSRQLQAENILAKHYAATNRKQAADLWFHRAIATYHRQRASLKSLELQLPFLENGSDLYLDYMEYLIREGKPEAALQLLDQSRAETLTDGLGVADAHKTQPPASPHTLAARLHGTILIYCLRTEHSYLWAVTRTRQQLYTLPGSASILPVVARHTQAILASKDLLTQPDSTGRALYDALVRPAEALIPKVSPGQDSRVFLIADKGLNDLNFETLIPPGNQPHYWIEDATITNARSLRLLAAGGPKRNTAAHRLLLIGNPVYRADEYAPLPKAATEMASVASHFPADAQTVLAGAQATPPGYTLANAGAANYIHFVAHATADAMTPLDSAIILSHPDASAPAKLYAADILKQPLTADLVTLSACYGTGTRTYSGEGLVGLVWAFLRAGAHSVIGALWEVSDVSTPQLMDTLYGELLRGSPPDAALRSAKLAMLHGGGVFRKPLYWAPFQLYAGH